MELEIEIIEKQIILSLRESDLILDRLSWEENNDLSRILLEKIDFLLKKHKLEKKNIKICVKIAEKFNEFTSSRIARAIADSYNLATGLKL